MDVLKFIERKKMKDENLEICAPFSKAYDTVINKIVDGKEIDMKGYVELQENGKTVAYVDGRRLVDGNSFPDRFL